MADESLANPREHYRPRALRASRLFCALVLTLAAVLLLASSGSTTSIVLEFLRTAPAELDYFVPVLAPQAHCLAVSDAFHWLAIGHMAGQPAQLTLSRLDAKGQLVGKEIAVQTPCPRSLKARGHHVVSLAFHPSLPLLYVWQDVEAIKSKKPIMEDPAWKDFDHLLIYALDGPAPFLLLSMAQGPGFFTGTTGGTVAVDLPNGRLFVPNLRLAQKKKTLKPTSGIGWYHLDGDGLPLVGETAPGNPAPPASPDEAAAAWSRRRTALRAALAAGKPVGALVTSPPNANCFPRPTSGAGIFPVNRDVLIIGGPFGPVTWDRLNRRAQMQMLQLSKSYAQVAEHPTLPVIYATGSPGRELYCVEHVAGFLTLAPQIVEMTKGQARTAPVVLAKRGMVAVGGVGAVHLVHLDAAGKIAPTPGLQITLQGSVINALAYSDKFDRLYVAVRKKPS